jgi:trehalose-6-phosphate synthase
MKITFRLIFSLMLTALVVTGFLSYFQTRNEKIRMKEELVSRATIISESFQNSTQDLIQNDYYFTLKKLIPHFGYRNKLIGIIAQDSLGKDLSASSLNVLRFADTLKNVMVKPGEKYKSSFIKVGGENLFTYSAPLSFEQRTVGYILFIYNATYIDDDITRIWESNFIGTFIQTFLIIIITILVVRWSVTGHIKQITRWIKNLRIGKVVQHHTIPEAVFLKPLTDEVTLMANSLTAAKNAAREEAKLRIKSESIWTAEKLREQMTNEIGNKSLFVISNREPFIHTKVNGKIEYGIPPGGLVTALDPILRSCGGVWIAQGTGDADMETTDENGRLSVPPDEPEYTLHRVFLSKEEENGYYYGFSNEGLWPLCHITHTRPIFRLEDWEQYQKVNQKFADVLIEEIKNVNEPLVLIQDYHFALLPLLIKSRRPDTRVALFWHIPWPNPEVIGICPWKNEILVGLLGADLIGFHIQFHCNNFLETVDRFLESKINRDQFAVERGGNLTYVKPFPISIQFPTTKTDGNFLPQRKELRKYVFDRIGINTEYLGVGVDRIDYTKGIIERFRGIERSLEKYPELIGRLTFVELGAPSRTHIKRYQDLMNELEEVIEKINSRFRSKGWKPIVFLKAQHSHNEINKFYSASDFCLVTSLHDGMNLVAKEYISSRGDESGVLILSQFTGAAHELEDAILINPYSIEEIADAIFRAINMDTKEKMERMHRMRETLRERNVYRWAGNIVSTLSRIRINAQVNQTME